MKSIKLKKCYKWQHNIEFVATGYYSGMSYMGLVSRKMSKPTGAIQDVYYPFKTRIEYQEWYEENINNEK